MNNKNIIIVAIIVAIVFGGAGFYGGMLYGKSQATNSNGQRLGMQGQFSQGNRTGSTGRRASGAGFVSGQIIAKDDKSITVKSSDGGSKYILLSDSTVISKSATGTVNDLVNGGQVIVNGSTDPSGSIVASNIQIRPAGQDFPGRGAGAGGPQGTGSVNLGSPTAPNPGN
jgi:hypothetical protein